MKRDRSRLPALLAVLLAAGLFSGAAALGSGLSSQPPAAEMMSVVLGAGRRAVVKKEEPLPQPNPTPTPENQPVEDTYFEDAAFLGDSRTEGFKLYSGLKAGSYFHAVGATVESVFTKPVETEMGKMPLLDAMAQKDFGKIYIMLGINELGWNGTETFKSQYARLIARLRADHPESAIVLQTILPVSAGQEEKGSYVNNQRIVEYNQVLRELSAELGCFYVDTAEAVTDEAGCLREEWTWDGIHLNPEGCAALLQYLRGHSV